MINVSRKLSAPFGVDRLEWSSLVLKTSVLGISGATKVSMNLVPLERLAGQLIEIRHEKASMPDGRDILLADYQTRAMGINMRDQLWFAADSAALLQRVRINKIPGDERYRAYRFTRIGVIRIRKKPKKNREKESVEKWSDTKSSFNRFSEKVPDGIDVIAPSALLYIVSVTDFEAVGKTMELMGYFDDSLHIVSIQTEKNEKLNVDFTAVSANRKQRFTGSREALRFSLTARPFAGQDYESGLELAGLKEDLEIYVDKQMRVPLELRGKADWFGRLRLRLRSVVLR